MRLFIRNAMTENNAYQRAPPIAGCKRKIPFFASSRQNIAGFALTLHMKCAMMKKGVCKMWESLLTAGEHGSEGGVILRDETYRDQSRITLEDCGGHCAITCGIYGAFVHTAYCGKTDGMQQYTAMKTELQRFLQTDTTADEEIAFYESFAARY